MNRLPLVARMALLCCSLGFGAVPLTSLAAETGFPARPVTLVIPFPPGGATDVNGRVIAQKLGKELGQPVVIENRGGAGSSMQAMAEEVGASVYLAVRDGMEMVLIEACRPRSSMLSARLDVGSRAPLANSALGRAYLSALPEAQRNQLVDSMRLLRGPEWDGIAPSMNRAIGESKRLGYCLSLGEFHREINSVSVPLIGPDGEVMALNGGGAAFVFTEDRLRNELAPRLHDIALSIARDIGGHVPTPSPG